MPSGFNPACLKSCRNHLEPSFFSCRSFFVSRHSLLALAGCLPALALLLSLSLRAPSCVHLVMTLCVLALIVRRSASVRGLQCLLHILMCCLVFSRLPVSPCLSLFAQPNYCSFVLYLLYFVLQLRFSGLFLCRHTGLL